MKKFSQTFVRYHGRGHCYLDGTKTLIQTGRRCVMETNNPFRKKPIDACNKIAKSTRNQLKTEAKQSFMKRYFKFLNAFEKDKFDDASFSSDYSTNDESESDITDYESITGNATETEQNLTDYELTGDKLIIDENTDDNHANRNSSSNNQTPNNKETNNKILPLHI